MSSCIAIVKYGMLECHPPVMTLMLILKKLGRPVHFIGIRSDAGLRFLQENQIPYDFIPYGVTHNRLLRALRFYAKRRFVIQVLKHLKEMHGAVVPWFQECHSAALAGDEAFGFGKCITTFYEFELNYGRKWFGFDFVRMMRENVIVECEVNRAFMTQAIHHLDQTPLVVTNKPQVELMEVPALSKEISDIFDKIGSRPVFLYQGFISDERADIPLVLETISKNRPNYCVVCLTGNKQIRTTLHPYANAFVIDAIPAPAHLAVTARATVGIAAYNGSGGPAWYLNSIYCAPNKIYEYAAFGVPTLCNCIPGLLYSIGTARAGICCNLTEDSILRAADELVASIDEFRKNARRFYEAVDLERQVSAVLERAFS